jgi:hypothetical protein
MTALIVPATKVALITSNTATTKDYNYGAAVSFQTGSGIAAVTVSGLLLFDLSGLLAGTIINSAYISVFSASALNANHSQLLLIPVADIDWVEGSELGGIEVGANCWNWHTYNTVAWSGGAGCLGGTLLALFDTPTPQFAETQITIDPAVVQVWVGPAGINPGVIARGVGSASPRAMHSNDYTNPIYRPKITLDVTYPSNLKRILTLPHYRM